MPPARTNRVIPSVPMIHRPVGEALEAGVVIAATEAASVDVVLAGCRRWRVRIKATAAGVLSAAYLRPDDLAPYTANNPANVNVSANTETLMEADETEYYGEARLRLTFTAGVAPSTIAYVDVMGVQAD